MKKRWEKKKKKWRRRRKRSKTTTTTRRLLNEILSAFVALWTRATIISLLMMTKKRAA